MLARNDDFSLLSRVLQEPQREQNFLPINGGKEKIFQESAGGVGAKAIKGLQ
jgi:hypothetical protein